MEITAAQNTIDGRDVLDRIAELEHEKDEAEGEGIDFADEFPDEAEELEALLALDSEASDYAPDWPDGAYLIHEDHFRDYAKDMAESIGAIDTSAGWPMDHIDWEAAAEELKTDYTEIEWQGVTYYCR